MHVCQERHREQWHLDKRKERLSSGTTSFGSLRPHPAFLVALGPEEGRAVDRQAPLTIFLALMLRVRQMTSRISCTGTDTGAPNSELKRIRAGNPQQRHPSRTPHPPSTSLLMRKVTPLSQPILLPPALTPTPEHESQAAGQSRKPLPKPEKDMGIAIL